jgi:hypothetical protein
MDRHLADIVLFLALLVFCVLAVVAAWAANRRLRQARSRSLARTIPGLAVPMCKYRWGSLVTVYIEGREFDNHWMPTLAGLRSLEELQLAYTGVSDEGMAAVKDLHRLKSLWLYDDKMGDGAVFHLAGLSNLELLSLRLNSISGDALRRLGELRSLTRLTLDIDKINATAVDELRTKLPDCDVVVVGEG